ncbi:MAG: hypothetical protein LUH21_23325 [Clostridiales bacterium]|nr:hypothetical protein [Clostridiales bacterium]
MNTMLFKRYRKGSRYCFYRCEEGDIYASASLDKEEITPAEVLGRDGYILFLDIADSDGGQVPDADSDVLWHEVEKILFKSPAPAGFLWLLACKGGTLGWKKQMLTCQVQAGRWLFLYKSCIRLTRYQTGIAGGATVQWQEERRRFAIQREEKAGALVCGRCAYPSEGPVYIGAGSDDMGVISGSFWIGPEQICEFFQDMEIGIRYQMMQRPGIKEESIHTVKFCPIPLEKKENRLFLVMNPNRLLDPAQTFLCLQQEIVCKGLMQDLYGNDCNAILDSKVHFVFQPEVLCRKSEYSGQPVFIQAFYLTLSGEVRFEMKNRKILCGANGSEFFKGCAEVETGRFLPGGAAFLEPDKDQEMLVHTRTAYISFGPGVRYYCQAGQIRLFCAGGRENLLKPFDYPAAVMKEGCGVPYLPCGLARVQGFGPQKKEMEEGLSRLRLMTAQRLRGMEGSGNEQDVIQTLSNQGLLVQIQEDGTWGSIGLAHTKKEGISPSLRFTDIREAMVERLRQREVLLSFSGNDLEGMVSHPYYVNDWAYQILAGTFHDERIASLYGKVFETEVLYRAAVDRLDPSYFEEDGKREVFLKAAADFEVEAEGWRFLLSPHCFRRNGDDNDTVLILKYTKSFSLGEWAESEGKEGEREKRILKSVTAKMRVKKENGIEFLECLDNKAWCGLLALNVPVQTARLDTELSFLLDGVDQDQFYAVYLSVGRNQAEVSGEDISLLPSMVQAMIDYEDPVGGARVMDGAAAGLRTTALYLEVKDSRVCQLRSTSELSLNRLFGAETEKMDTTSGRAMIMEGSGTRMGDMTRYFFHLREKADYACQSPGITSFWIKEVQFLCGNEKQIKLSGTLCLHQETDCDIGCYGLGEEGLAFSIVLREDAKWKERPSYSPDYRTLSAEPGQSIPREDALVSRFPAELAGFTWEEKVPCDLGFTSVSCPLRQGRITAPCFLLRYRLTLGTLGGLMGDAPVTAELAAGFEAEPSEGGGWFVGIRFGENGGFRGFNLQSVLEMGFKTISLKTQRKQGCLLYVLELRNFNVSFAGYRFPPGNNSITVFADGADPHKTGWYASYMDEEECHGGSGNG